MEFELTGPLHHCSSSSQTPVKDLSISIKAALKAPQMVLVCRPLWFKRYGRSSFGLDSVSLQSLQSLPFTWHPSLGDVDKLDGYIKSTYIQLLINPLGLDTAWVAAEILNFEYAIISSSFTLYAYHQCHYNCQV